MEPKAATPKKMTKRQRLAAKREGRKPITGRIQKLKFDVPDGYVGRWFNDIGPRIQQAVEAGWEFIDAKTKLNVETDDLGTVVRIRVDKKLTNEPVFAYLMVIEKELYDEDQAAKIDDVHETEKQIVKGKNPQTKDAIDGDLVYVKSADLRGEPL